MVQLINKRQVISKVSRLKLSTKHTVSNMLSPCCSEDICSNALFCAPSFSYLSQSQCTVVQGHNDHTTTEVNSFKLLLVTYVYNAALFTFVPLPEMPPQLPAQLCSAARALQAIEQGKHWLKNSCLSYLYEGFVSRSSGIHLLCVQPCFRCLCFSRCSSGGKSQLNMVLPCSCYTTVFWNSHNVLHSLCAGR